MARKIRRIIFIVVLVAFVGVMGYIAYTYISYGKERGINEEAAQTFVTKVDRKSKNETQDNPTSIDSATVEDDTEYPPIEVDFDSLLAINPDVIGWIYCEDTVINYPILKGEDNDLYLHHNYLGQYVASGSIFMDCADLDDFLDSNSILYGHHMRDKSMFATLSYWADQSYFDAHPIMWILTPKQNYKLELFSEYTTHATSDSYYIIRTPGADMDAYLNRASQQSNITSDVSLESDGHYVMLSTCAYAFENARTVLHGKLVTVGGAGDN